MDYSIILREINNNNIKGNVMIKSYIIPVFLSEIYMRIKCKIFVKSKKIFVF